MDSKKFIDICKEAVIAYANENSRRQIRFKLPKKMYLLFGAAKHCKTIKLCSAQRFQMVCIMN